MKDKHTAKRIGNGRYMYRGYKIYSYYYEPEHRVVWEAEDKDKSGFAHAFTLRECKKWIDNEIERN